MLKFNVRKILVCGIILLFVGAGIIPSMSGTTVEKQIFKESKSSLMGFNPRGNILYVGGSGPNNYTSIQDAIDDASNGDTVFVYSGLYDEYYPENGCCVFINKTINLIGEDKNSTFIDGSNTEDWKYIVEIYGDSVNMTGFTVQNGNDNGGNGIFVNSDNCNICGNNIDNFDHNGIVIFWTNSTVVANNYITNCKSNGIYLFDDNENCVISNNIIHSGGTGIAIEDVTFCSIINNTITDTHTGIWGDINNHTCGPKYNLIAGNIIIEFEYEGILMIHGDNNHITNNYIDQGSIVQSDGEYGIAMYHDADNNNASYNTILKARIGIFIGNSYNCTLYMNNITDCLTAIEIWFDPPSNIRNIGHLANNKPNVVKKNNFRRTIFNALSRFHPQIGDIECRWEENYWGRPRILPKVIVGFRMITDIIGFPAKLEFDLSPAKQPYDIPQIAI